MSIKYTAIIIGLGAYNDLGVIRSCGMAGMNVVSICPPTAIVPIYTSKYVTQHIFCDVKSESEIINLVNQISTDKSQKYILYPTSDYASLILDKNFSIFQRKENIICPNANGNLNALMDKAYMTELANKSGLQVPHSKKLTLNETKNFSPNFPCIIKPLQSIYGEKSDISICYGSKDWENALKTFKGHHTEKLLVQELINGAEQSEIAVTGVSTETGAIYIKGCIEKIRTFGNGSTVFGNFIPEISKNLESKIIDFIKNTGFTGIFDMEFLRNKSGIYFIECNFRNGAYGYAVTCGGFNMPLCYAMQTDKSVKHLRKVKFMEERTDVLFPLKYGMSKTKWAKDFFNSDVLLWWDINDIRPFINYYISKLKKILKK